MAENQLNAYFVDEALIKRGFGSGSAEVIDSVLEDRNGLVASYRERFSGKTLEEAIADLVNGYEADNWPFHYSFGLWIIVDSLAGQRPDEPRSELFVDLYGFNEALEEQSAFPLLSAFFKALNNEAPNDFPYQLKSWGDMPCFAYADYARIARMAPELARFSTALADEESWLDKVDDLEDLEVVVAWLEQALEEKRNLMLVLEGSL